MELFFFVLTQMLDSLGFVSLGVQCHITGVVQTSHSAETLFSVGLFINVQEFDMLGIRDEKSFHIMDIIVETKSRRLHDME